MSFAPCMGVQARLRSWCSPIRPRPSTRRKRWRGLTVRRGSMARSSPTPTPSRTRSFALGMPCARSSKVDQSMNDATANRHHALEDDTLCMSGLLPDGAAGIDVGLTLAKIARATTQGVELLVRPTTDAPEHLRVLAQPDERAAAPFGVTGARVDRIDSQ